MEATIVGTVKEVRIYPVKSMRGMAVEEASLYWYGVNGDRKYAFTRAGNLSGFPWLTAREAPAMLQYAPYFVQPESPLESAIRVRTPGGRDLPLESAELQAELAEAYGDGIEFVRLKRGTFDSMPLSVMTTGTVARLAQAAGRALDVRRFRPNIVIEGVDGAREEAWASATIVFGAGEDGARVQMNQSIKRCVMINLDPDSAEADAGVLKAAAAENGSMAGMYGSVSQPGMVRRGDVVTLWRW